MGTPFKGEIVIDTLGLKHRDLIPQAYIPVFEDHPWHEEFECICGAGPYSHGCKHSKETRGRCAEFASGKLYLLSEHANCVKCGQDLKTSLRGIFTPENVKEDFDAVIAKPGFLGQGAFEGDSLIGLCWGYNLPLNHPKQSGNTWYNEACELLSERGIDPSETFYHNESGTLYQHRGKGIGTNLLRSMLIRAANLNKHHVAFRTINPSLSTCYEKIFEMSKGSLIPLFTDPNPDKRQNWYVLNLDRLE